MDLFDCVYLKNDRPDLGITTSNIGTIIDIVHNRYTVEFTDEFGNTIDSSLDTDFSVEELRKA